ncbi:DUF3375 domain-containing protein [Geothermobacter hydrogeniphilus]|uniref:DUF3375 domain-containing protein n=1 Tax=Geothermobacter hydrogeniphilus TaxID=1969733 RepID=A0A2K2H900_9BACT|nr:DUF3375 domain-containing protein [Geothermobacter hydrogeniphilus]PNU19709.1 DUF3375 domain-containing protein [Geothermobacter hydrogeniphilus]
MTAQKTIASYRRMRQQPLWRLLAADNGPVIIGLLQTLLYEKERSLPASLLIERLDRELEELRNRGDDFPQTAQAYIAGWLRDGYLERRYPSGSSEEEYELSTASVDAIRFLQGQIKPHSAATESRLSLVIQSLVGLAEETDRDKYRRIDHLIAEQERIEQEIESIQQGRMKVLPRPVAVERTREIIALAEDLTGDFRRVRDQFEQLNRELRECIMDSDGHRGDVLDSLFAGIDLIAESDAGRSFSAFWRLLTDPEQSATLEEALDSVLSRGFVGELQFEERRFLLRLTRNLLEQGGSVHEVLQTFARSLKHFVQSREFLEQRRINQLLQKAQQAALLLKEEVKATEDLHYILELTSCRLRSFSQLVLHDPSLQAEAEPMGDGEAAPIDLDTVSELVAQSEIDFRSLKADILACLENCTQVTIAEVLRSFPASQGLGSVVGLLALASRHGMDGKETEQVVWTGDDGVTRAAQIPKYYFLKEQCDGLQ